MFKIFNKNNHFFGLGIEKFAMIIFLCKGYQIVAWRYKTPFGEIDLVVKKSNILVFVEVKSTYRILFNPENAFRQNQIKRFFNAVEFFVKNNLQFVNLPRRFDLFEFKGFFSYKHHLNFIS